eukprot:COSAG06_NODE_186_length_20792_cov_1041.487443_8_plen_112_part_00
MEFTPEEVLKGEPESLAGERWWTVDVATGGINPEEVAVDWAGKGVSDLKTALKERGLAEELKSDPVSTRHWIVSFQLGQTVLSICAELVSSDHRFGFVYCNKTHMKRFCFI